MRVIGRYALFRAIAAGGMATVHLGRLIGPAGFSRTVAIKRLHAQYASDPEFVSMFLDEARLAARIRHPNVVPTLDVVTTQGELFLVMEYVPGESLSRLARQSFERGHGVPIRVVAGVIAGALHGLHAAHEAKDERGMPLGIVHRDVSPQNVLVGVDGVPKILDFGVAKAAGRIQTTREGQIKGKLSYMPPEQLRGTNVTRQSDIYAAGVMLWEMLAGARLFDGDNEGAIVAQVLEGRIDPASHIVRRMRHVSPQELAALEVLDRIIARATSAMPERRFATAREMAIEIERAVAPATASEIGDWVEHTAHDVLRSRAGLVAELESGTMLRVDEAPPQTMAFGQPPVAVHGPAPLGLPRDPRERSSSHALHASTTAPIGPHGYMDAQPPFTQPSSISVAAATPVPAAPQRPWLIASAGIVVGMLFVLGVLVFKRTDHGSAGPATPIPEATAAPTATAATEPEPTPAPTAGTSVAPPPSDPPTTPTAQPTAKPAPTQKKVSVRPPPPKDDCASPYWYDAQGVKHYKEKCLK